MLGGQIALNIIPNLINPIDFRAPILLANTKDMSCSGPGGPGLIAMHGNGSTQIMLPKSFSCVLIVSF